MSIVWTAQARDDLQDLRAYIARENPPAAAGIAKRILDSVELLAGQPGMGRPGRLPGTRELVISDTPYFMPYRFNGGVLEILAIIHGARRWPPR